MFRVKTASPVISTRSLPRKNARCPGCARGGHRLPVRQAGHASRRVERPGGARAFYDAQRAAGVEHNAALRKLASRLVGILHGCLKTRTLYDESTAWSHRENKLAA